MLLVGWSAAWFTRVIQTQTQTHDKRIFVLSFVWLFCLWLWFRLFHVLVLMSEFILRNTVYVSSFVSFKCFHSLCSCGPGFIDKRLENLPLKEIPRHPKEFPLHGGVMSILSNNKLGSSTIPRSSARSTIPLSVNLS